MVWSCESIWMFNMSSDAFPNVILLLSALSLYTHVYLEVA